MKNKILKNKKLLITLALVIVIIYVVWKNRWWLQRWIIGKQVNTNAIELEPPEGVGMNKDKVLYKGIYAPVEVSVLQRMLFDDGQDLGSTGPGADGVDGVFGPKTEAALLDQTGKKKSSINEYKAFSDSQLEAEIQ